MGSCWVWCVVCVAALSGGPFVAVGGAQEEGDLRLQGDTAKVGRLEIYHDGQWGTVCDDRFTKVTAGVACRLLGHTGSSTFYTAGDGSGPIWLDSVECQGHETSLAACRHDGWGIDDCSHAEDVGVACAGASPPPPSPPSLTARFDPAPPATHEADPFTVRLSFSEAVTIRPRVFKRRGLKVTGGTVTRVRRVQKRKDRWKITIQPTNATTDVTISLRAHRACTARGALCTADGRPLSIPLRHTVWGQSDPTASEGDLRLQGGTAKRGRLEVYHNGRWGTVCDDRFTKVTAGVACRQLGHTGGGTFYTAGDGSGPIWLDSVECRGHETSLTACRHDGWGIDDCSHAEDVGVECTGTQPMLLQSPQRAIRRAPGVMAPSIRPDRDSLEMPDTALRAALRHALDIAPGVPLTAATLATVTTLDLSGAGIGDLTGLEQARNLESLFLADNQITDLSPLAGLAHLESLSLGGNRIADLWPLAGLVRLEFLALADNRITDLSPLAGLVHLELLFVAGNQITDFSPLAELPRVTIDGQAAQSRPATAE